MLEMTVRRSLVPGLLLALVVCCACGEETAQPGDMGVDHGDGGDASPLDAAADVSFDVVEEGSIDAAVIVDLTVVANPSNALSVFVDWTTAVETVSRLRITCGDDYDQTFAGERAATAHRVFVMGLYAGATCVAEVSGAGRAQAVSFTVGDVPSQLPELTVVVDDSAARQPGWTLVNLNNNFDEIPLHAALIDGQGRYRWYHARATVWAGACTDVRTTAQGVLIGGSQDRPPAALVAWEGSLLWESTFRMHHHIAPVGGSPQRFRFTGYTTECPESVESGLIGEYDWVREELVWSWRLCDHYAPPTLMPDWDHLNAVEEFPGEDALIISSRNQNSLFKVDRTSGELVWTMGYAGGAHQGFNGDFEMAPADRFLHQHAPEFLPNGNLLLFDNGQRGYRAYSRVVEIAYDEADMTAEVVWEYRHQPDLYTPVFGDADRLDNGNTLITFGTRTTADEHTHLVEVTAEREVVWELTLPVRWGIYRSQRVSQPPLGYVVPPDDSAGPLTRP